MREINFNYENRNNKSYLIYEIEKPEEIDRYEKNIMASNKIDGLLEFVYSNIDDKHCFKYDITSKISLKMYLDRCKDEEKIIKIFINIFKLFIEIEDFMLLKEHLFLHDDYVFIDVSSLQLYFICLPIENISSENEIDTGNIKLFINKLLNKLVIDRFENKYSLSLLKEFLTKEEFLNIEETIKVLKNMLQDKKNKEMGTVSKSVHYEEKNDFKKIELENVDSNQERKIKKINQDNFNFLIPGQEKEKNTDKLKKIKKEAKKKINIKNIFSFSSFADKKKDINEKDEKNKNEVFIESKNSKSNDQAEEVCYDKTVIIKNSADNGRTVLLNALNSGLYKSMPYLIRKKNNEKINITSNLFRIGKEIDYVDYAILDNSTISRAHADIIKINNEYFIQDNNSKNHSYINEVMISDGQAAKIEHNSEIKLSDEVFIFKLY